MNGKHTYDLSNSPNRFTKSTTVSLSLTGILTEVFPVALSSVTSSSTSAFEARTLLHHTPSVLQQRFLVLLTVKIATSQSNGKFILLFDTNLLHSNRCKLLCKIIFQSMPSSRADNTGFRKATFAGGFNFL